MNGFKDAMQLLNNGILLPKEEKEKRLKDVVDKYLYPIAYNKGKVDSNFLCICSIVSDHYEVQRNNQVEQSKVR